MAGRKLFSTSCDDDGNLAIELMKPTRAQLEKAEFICANLARAVPELAEDAGGAADFLARILEKCDEADGTDVLEEGDETEVFEPAVTMAAEAVC